MLIGTACGRTNKGTTDEPGIRSRNGTAKQLTHEVTYTTGGAASTPAGGGSRMARVVIVVGPLLAAARWRRPLAVCHLATLPGRATEGVRPR